jgi:hypothetical protein
MSTKDGGQAFPHGDPTHGGDIGMTLRDYFAARVIQGLAARLLDSDMYELRTEIRGGLNEARIAYQMADAMLKAREQS